MSRITIEVRAVNETPVENASIYIKYIEERKVMKDKKLELNGRRTRRPSLPDGRWEECSCSRADDGRRTGAGTIQRGEADDQIH